MSTKTKIVLSIGAVCMVAVVAVVAIVAVFAATQQQFSSTINVSYVAKEVDCVVKANWYEAGTLGGAMKNGAADNITFTPGLTAQTGSLAPTKSTIELSESVKYVVFEYIFENHGKAFAAKLSYADDGNADTNVKIYRSTQGFTKENAANLAAGNTNVTELTGKQSGDFITFDVPNGVSQNTTSYAYVVIAIGEIGEDASFSGTFTWNLTSTGK